MTGNIYINGVIGDYPGEDQTVTLLDVIGQVKEQPKATKLNVYINSEGGIVEVGFAIHDYLKSLKMPVKTIGTGIVASMGTVIFMAGDEREIMPNTDFMIHLPWQNASGSSDELLEYSKQLKKVEKKVIDFYVKTYGLTQEAIEPLLKEETWLTPDQLKSLGITTQNTQPARVHAKVRLTTDKNNKNKNTMSKKEHTTILESIFNAIKGLSKTDPVMKILYTADGDELDFYELEESAEISDGDKARIGDEDANGEITLQDGRRLLFSDGVLEEMHEAEEEEEEEEEDEMSDEMKKLTADKEALELELSTLKEDKEAVEVEFAKLKKTHKSAMAIINKVEKLESELKIEMKKERKKDEPKVSKVGKAIQNIKARK